MYADTHCHLDFEVFDARLPKIISAMRKNKLGFVVIPSVALKYFDKVERLCAQYDEFYMGLGLHPYFIREHCENDLNKLEASIDRLLSTKDSKLVALGEIGLDADCPQIEKQQSLFEAQLRLAKKYNLPVIVHSRKSNERMFKCLSEAKINSGVIHAFSGSYELMMRFIRLGYNIGVGPVITWPGASKTREAIMRAPLEALVLETDAPGMFISGLNEKQASPLDVITVFRELTSMRSESETLIRDSLWQQSKALFGIRPDLDTKNL